MLHHIYGPLSRVFSTMFTAAERQEINSNEDERERKRKHEEGNESCDSSSDSSCDSDATDYKKERKDEEQAAAPDPDSFRLKKNSQVKRYMIQIPKSLLPIKTADAQELNQRYNSIGIPPDFIFANIKWPEFFAPDKPFSLKRPCKFHIMHDMIEASDTQLLRPFDANWLYSAKVMLLELPSVYEIYHKSFDNSADKTHCAVHPWHLINFLVGVEGGVETAAIGGPWSPSLDGENPDKDPAVLIRTAIRTCKALTGIDLTSCTKWYRFVEIYYHREYAIREDEYVQTVVIYLPDVRSLMPNLDEWQTLLEVYKDTADDGDESHAGDSVVNSVNESTKNNTTDDNQDTATDFPNKYIQTSAEWTEIEKEGALPTSPHMIVRPNRRARGGKFDCVLKPMSVLLDYHPDDLRESSFEISLFAELFNDMLMRDFGLKIYKEINLRAAEKDPHIWNAFETSLSQTLSLELVNDLRTSSHLGIDETIINPELLLSFVYFDTTQCGYFLGKDLENLFSILGLNLSRSEISKVLQQLDIHDASEPLHYHQFTHTAEPLDREPSIEVVNMADFESASVDSNADDSNEDSSTYIISSEDSAPEDVLPIFRKKK